MPAASCAEVTELSREAWMALLAKGVCGAQFEPPVRRKHRRYPVDLGSWRLLYHRYRKPFELRVKLLNAAPSGVMVLSREVVPEKADVLLAFGHGDKMHVLSGHVVHCTSTVGGHKVGVKLSFAPSGHPAR